MSEDMADAGPSPGAPSDLSLQTILKQQGIIDAMSEIITTLKTRVATLEAMNTNGLLPDSTAGTPKGTAGVAAEADAACEEAMSRFAQSVEQLTTERDAAVERCTELESSLKNSETKLVEALTRCKRFQQMEEECCTTRSLINLVEAQYGNMVLQCEMLEKELEASLLERVRWKALATSITNRLDAATRQRALLHIAALEKDEHTRMSIAARSMRPTQSMAVNASGGDTKRLLSPDALELVDVWNAKSTPSRLQPLPRGKIVAGCMQPTEVAHNNVMRRRVNRYLVPL